MEAYIRPLGLLALALIAAPGFQPAVAQDTTTYNNRLRGLIFSDRHTEG